jgi:hypothetical protein
MLYHYIEYEMNNAPKEVLTIEQKYEKLKQQRYDANKKMTKHLNKCVVNAPRRLTIKRRTLSWLNNLIIWLMKK